MEYLWYNDLVGGWPTHLKNTNVNLDDDIPNTWENKKCSKPATSKPVVEKGENGAGDWLVNHDNHDY